MHISSILFAFVVTSCTVHVTWSSSLRNKRQNTKIWFTPNRNIWGRVPAVPFVPYPFGNLRQSPNPQPPADPNSGGFRIKQLSPMQTQRRPPTTSKVMPAMAQEKLSSIIHVGPPASSGPLIYQPGVSQNQEPIYHRDFDIPEDRIIALPIGQFPEPKCNYTVLRDSCDGLPVSRSSRPIEIGDPLCHSWQCFPNSQSETNLYCIQVGNCKVTSGSQRVTLIDEQGCTVDEIIAPDVTYNGNMKASLAIEAFRLIGNEEFSINFNCKISILLMENGVCPRPQCRIYPSLRGGRHF